MPYMKPIRRARQVARYINLARLRRLLWAATLILGIAIIGIGIWVAVTLKNLPAPEELFSQRIVQSTKIYDRTGSVLLYEIHNEIRRTVIPFEEIPDAVKQATIAIEDAKFYQHGGIDLRGIMRALFVDITTGNFSQGGSTITQQLVKNSFLGRERTITRKAKEALMAMYLDARLSKDNILNLYLNQIPYGSNAYGIEAAAQTFFGKHAHDLSTAEAALLASMPRAPSFYSPYGQHTKELMQRKNMVLARMKDLGYLSADEARTATEEHITLLPAAKNIRAPHFVMFVRDYLIERYGETEVEEGGLVVTTTLDWPLQEAAEKIVREGAEQNDTLIGARNMALVAINPKSGEVLSMVGSRDYFDVKGEGNFNVATALRQPGSAFKPFVYATAFKEGFRPDTVLFDLPTEFNPLCDPNGQPRPGTTMGTDKCYHPQNYDETFRGPVTLRQAIAQSLSVPSVKLLYLAGVPDSIETAKDLGITTLGDKDRFGLSLVLGGAEVRLLDMVSAFGVFANDGMRTQPHAIKKIETATGRILEENNESPSPAIAPNVARTINDVLSDNDARIPAFQPHSSLYFPSARVAAKTGTTQDYRDAWTIGYTPSIVAGVWAGNNDNAPMRQKGSGVMASAPSWHRFMELAFTRFPPEDFPPPEQEEETVKPVLKGIWQGGTVVALDRISQKRATELTPPETREDVAFGEPHDPLYWIDRKDPTAAAPDRPERDPQFANWEAAFQAWVGKSGLTFRPLSLLPEGYDNVHSYENQPRVIVEKVSVDGQVITVQVNATAPLGVRDVLAVAGGRTIASRTYQNNPVIFVFSRDQFPQNLPTEVGIRAYDTAGNVGAATTTIP